jgi:transposase
LTAQSGRRRRPIGRTLLTKAARLQHDGFLLRQKTNAQIDALARDGLAIKAIVNNTGSSRKTIRAVLRGERAEVFRARTSSLEAWLIQRDAEWTGGCHNGAALWRRLQAVGFTGSLRVVGEWATRRRHCERARHSLSRTPSARRLARVMTVERTNLSRNDAVLVSAIETAIPSLVTTRGLMDHVRTMIRIKDDSDLQSWICDAMASPIASFAVGIRADQAAVAAAMTQPWSNGQTEGQITKLKLVKRPMYGRAKLDRLKAGLTARP